MQLAELLVIALALSMDAFAVSAANVVSYPQTSWRRLALMPLLFGLFQGLMPCLGYLLGSLALGLIERYAGLVAFIILAVIGGRMVFDGLRDLYRNRRSAAARDSKGRANSRDSKHDGKAAKGLRASGVTANEAATAGSTATVVSAGSAVDSSATAGSADGSAAKKLSPQTSDANEGTASQLTIASLLFEAVATSIDAFIVGVGFVALGINIWLAVSVIALVTAACCLIALLLGKRFGLWLGNRAVVVGGLALIAIGIEALF
ncbi:MAG: manganese efflux pump MntP family protein [Coriobacteriales bacterium]|jgi:putative Mn2+ efflux pump MntP|nr:manganese efflux pump MntP family protein [Coriobacteriales bacterium]